jgi:hypothetical protein
MEATSSHEHENTPSDQEKMRPGGETMYGSMCGGGFQHETSMGMCVEEACILADLD